MDIESLHTQIKRSIQDCSLSAVKEWVKKGADINYIDDGFMCKTKGYTLLHWAVKAESLEILSYLVENGVDYKNRVPKIGTLLDFSEVVTDLKIISYLLQLDFEVDKKRVFIENSIFYAGIHGHFKKIEYLVKGEYSRLSSDLLNLFKHIVSREAASDCYKINTKDRFGETILHTIARSKKSLETIKLLVSKGIDIEHKGDRGWTALDYAINSKNIDVISYLKKAGAIGDVSETMNEIAMYEAIEKDDLSYLQEYMVNSGDINIRINKKGHIKEPLLVISIENSSNLISNFLIDNNVDINLKDELYDSSALWYAATKGNLEILKKLIQKGDDLNSIGGGSDEGAGTILIGAVFYGNKEIVQYSSEAGANVNDVDAYGRTALHIARYEENGDIEKLLLQYNPDLEIIDDYGAKALEV